MQLITCISSSSSSSANCTAVGHDLSPRLPILYQASNLFWCWWVCLDYYAGNVLMKHQLWATGLAFAMLGWKRAYLLTNSFSGFLRICPKKWNCRCCISWMSRLVYSWILSSLFYRYLKFVNFYLVLPPAGYGPGSLLSLLGHSLTVDQRFKSGETLVNI